MSIRRRSTVHDLASLRLHPNGLRVQAGTSGEYGRETSGSRNSKEVHAKYLARHTGHDRRKNCIAPDASGTATIKRYRHSSFLKSVDSEGDEQIEEAEGLAEDVEGNAVTPVGPRESSQRRRRPLSSSAPEENENASDDVDLVKDYRAKKRRKFYHDFSFLDVPHTSSPALVTERASGSGPATPSQHAIEMDAAHSQPLLTVPSSDLLKYIHHFASGYYTAHGCLFNASKEARKARRVRKLAKLQNDVLGERGLSVSGRNTLELQPSDGSGNESDGSDNQIGDHAEGMEEDVERRRVGDRHKVSGKRQEKKPGANPRRDMYKAFDGSALMAIGMLLQEHVVAMAGAEAPEGWLQQIEALQALETSVVRGGKRDGTRTKVEAEVTASEAEESNDPYPIEEVGEETALDKSDESTSVSSSSESSSDE